MPPPSPLYTVPVVAHRVFGTSVQGVYQDRRRRSEYADPDFPGIGELPPVVIRGRVGDLTRTIDRAHGTRRSWEDVRAVFTPDPSLDYTAGLTVNDLWREAGIEFQLVDETDQMIASAMADFVPADVRVRDRLFEPLHRLGVINLYLCRALDGARGRGSLYLPHVPDRPVFAMVHDDEGVSDRARRWIRALITIAHEFGHVLGLNHVPWTRNFMYGEGTRDDSRGIEAPQWAHARYRARYLAGVEAPRSRLRPDVPTPVWPPI